MPASDTDGDKYPMPWHLRWTAPTVGEHQEILPHDMLFYCGPIQGLPQPSTALASVAPSPRPSTGPSAPVRRGMSAEAWRAQVAAATDKAEAVRQARLTSYCGQILQGTPHPEEARASQHRP